jgi:hypothetical protein
VTVEQEAPSSVLTGGGVVDLGRRPWVGEGRRILLDWFVRISARACMWKTTLGGRQAAWAGG